MPVAPVSRPSTLATGPALEVVDLSKAYLGARPRWSGARPVIEAIRGVSFRAAPGGILGIVGETGSGKSTLARCIAGLTQPSAGRVVWGDVTLTALTREQWRLTRRRLQIVLQNPYSTLDPRMSVGQIVAEPLANFEIGTPRDRLEMVRETLATVGLAPSLAGSRPAALSGGQRQRVALARALVLRPELLILDEPVSALDVSVQAQVLNLLLQLHRALGLSYLVIVHDLAVARQVCDSLVVMFAGAVVEEGPADAILSRPMHPYTRQLVAASPEIGKDRTDGRAAAGDAARPPGAVHRPIGCRYRPRCQLTQGEPVCGTVDPELRELEPGRRVACHLSPEGSADG